MNNSALVDLGLIISANLYNLLMIVVFLSRVRRQKRLEKAAGLVTVLIGVPLILAAILNAAARRELWSLLLPLPLTLHCALELFVDYIWKLDFRSMRWLWPYLGLFYLGQWLLIGYAFAVGKPSGFITLLTYFLCLGAAAYSYTKVRHG
jgi:hypothetical protein